VHDLASPFSTGIGRGSVKSIPDMNIRKRSLSKHSRESDVLSKVRSSATRSFNNSQF